MLAWLSKNIATIIICLVLAVIVALIIFSLVKNKKKGKSSCGCNCSQCPSSGLCHANQADQALPKGRFDHAAREKTP